ncbi:MAG TPA: hypothetical protein VMC43_03670 [Candidatus Paceibacterota bacterium]|nr:hypothetical protein [Candidatus Paceibacterota bacterium]
MRQCEICGKGSVIRGHRKLLRGHHNPVNYSRKYPNLQFTKVNGRRVLACANCIRTQTKTPRTRKVSTTKKPA